MLPWLLQDAVPIAEDPVMAEGRHHLAGLATSSEDHRDPAADAMGFVNLGLDEAL